jgi:glycosyltransferase involved in cell wall biosynthesis
LNLLPAASLMSRYRRARLALVIHGIEAWQPPTHGVAGAMVNRVDAFIAVSRHSAERFLSWSKLPARRGHVLPNCVDLEYFKPQARDERLAARYGLRSSTVIMTLGRLAPQERYKGFDEILEIMPRLLAARPNLKYLIVGDGPDRARLAAKSQALGVVGNVVFAGRIEEREKVAHYSLADAYVMPSSGEGFGIVLIEAAACGIPVIGSAVDGSREALLDGRLGGMVDPRNPDELVASILEVLAEERPRRRPPEVEIFGVGHFRARVDDWVRAQAALGLSQRSSVSPISAAPNANSPISNDVG